MSLSAERLAELAAAEGFEPATLEKVIRLGEVLEDFTRHPLLSRVLVLKGGTALNLSSGPPTRLSVDLDLNYVGALDREEMLRERPDVEQAVERIGRARGYKVQRSADEHAGRKFYLAYRSAAGTADRIEIDLNFLHRLPLGPPREAELWQPGDRVRPRARVVSTEELCVGKMCALLGRALPRDLYDAARLPSLAGDSWESPRFRALFVAMAGVLDHPLYSYGPDRFGRVTDAVIGEQLFPMLPLRGRPSARTLRESASSIIGPFLSLSEAEREYSARLQVGNLQPEVLFPDDDGMARMLGRHPALLWKVRNAARHARRGARGAPEGRD